MAVVLIYVLPMVLPSLIYVLWRLWRARRPAVAASAPDVAASAPDDAEAATAVAPAPIDWRTAPWLWLVLAGAALLVLVLLTGVFTEGAKDEGRYLPPRMDNGRILPGEMRPDTGNPVPRANESAPP